VVGAAWAFAPPAPTCADATAATPAGGGAAPVSLACTAPAGATVTYGIVAGPAHGSLSAVNQANGQLTYTSPSGYAGPDTFTYHLSDQWGVSNVATVTVTVPAFAVPTCANVSGRAAKGAARTTVTLSCTGPAGTPISYAIVSPPADGTLGPLDQATGRVSYTAQLGYSGTDRFIYRATDAGGASATASGTITIPALSRITSTMGWFFHPTRRTSTVVQQLSVNAVPARATVKLSCATRGCPIKPRTEKLAHRRVCSGKGKKHKCRTAAPPAGGTIDLTRLVKGKHVHVGAQIRVSILSPATVGKQYVFTIRPNRQPSVTIVSLAPGGTTPCPVC
jgi:Bacterial Ig domain